jgi:hypothetical protein
MHKRHFLPMIVMACAQIASGTLTAMMSQDESKLICAALNNQPITQYFEDNYELSTQTLNQAFYYAAQAGNTAALTTLVDYAVTEISPETITTAFHKLIENNNISEHDAINVLRYFFSQSSIYNNISCKDMRKALEQACKNNKFCIAFCLSGMLAQNVQAND